jgi:superfamily II DNA or RNA helicase
MVLAHNKNILKYIHDAIKHRNIATVGYYIGGMKEHALKETESKMVVIATYAMAAEALDIKSLSTLVMVTPKTDITQSVGRILRVKHDNPIIVDIVDSHDLFENQWTQRRRFYKKCNYRIREIDSKKYAGMNIDWNNDTTWKRTFDPKNKTDDVGTCKPTKDDSDDELDTKHGIGSGKCLINLSGLDDL